MLRARKEFIWDANHNPADYEENLGRGMTFLPGSEGAVHLTCNCEAVACEVLARRVIHVSPPDRITAMMSTRFTHRELDGDSSDKLSALEMAIDAHWSVVTLFGITSVLIS